MKTFILGDIHGAYKAMLQCFERSGFDKDSDQLIFLGDVADGWLEVYECVEELKSIKYLIWLLGNHDEWTQRWFRGDWYPSDDPRKPQKSNDSYIWISQGGSATVKSYLIKDVPNRKRNHVNFWLNKPQLYHLQDECLFVHGGIDWHFAPDDQTKDDSIFYWDRKMWDVAVYWSKRQKENTFKEYKEVFIGHTATNHYPDFIDHKPVHLQNLWNLDQGAGWDGKLTLMELETHHYWQSDIVTELYPGVKGRY